MICIDSELAIRLAKARAAVLKAELQFSVSETQGDYVAIGTAKREMEAATNAVADQLMSQGFHRMGED